MTAPLGELPSTSFLDSLGERGRRRAEPRTSIAIAGAGCALGILGVLIVAGDTGLDETNGDFNKFPGLVLSALVVAAGFFVLAQARRGAAATAGTVAAALGVPPFMFFLTFSGDKFPPYSTEGILIVSTGVWLAAYLVGPGRGRPFFLGAGLLGLWLTALQVTEKVFTAPFGLAESFFGLGQSTTFDDTGGDFGGDFGVGPSFDSPDPATIGVLSLAFGVAFLLVGRRLDRNGRHGAATPFALAALPCLVVGVLGLSPDLEAAGSGLLMVVIGLGLAYHGATVWRRATTWIGGAVTALGLAIFLGDMAGDDATIGGMLFIAGGIGLVLTGHAIAAAIREPDEMEITYGLVTVAAVPTMAAEAPVMPPPDQPQWAPPTPPTPPTPPAPPAPPIPPPTPPTPPPPPTPPIPPPPGAPEAPGAPGAPDDDPGIPPPPA